MNGSLIVIEGLDGSGKATQTARLCDYLQRAGAQYKQISFPNYDDPSSAPVRMYLSGELGRADEVGAYGASLFYAVDRYISFLKYWKSDYEAGGTIVSDRYATSNVAHQMSKLPREAWGDYLHWLEDLEYHRVGIPKPDVVLYLDMEPEVSRLLLAARYRGDESKKDIHEADFQYLLRCREAALYGAQQCGWRVIPCSRDGKPLPEPQIAETILKTLEQEKGWIPHFRI